MLVDINERAIETVTRGNMRFVEEGGQQSLRTAILDKKCLPWIHSAPLAKIQMSRRDASIFATKLPFRREGVILSDLGGDKKKRFQSRMKRTVL
jgi:hypothetical protein